MDVVNNYFPNTIGGLSNVQTGRLLHQSKSAAQCYSGAEHASACVALTKHCQLSNNEWHGA
jgi:hypothetical protein